MRFAAILLALVLTPIAQAQWVLQDAHTTADLCGIAALPSGAAWASGSNGTILRTEDAGFVWQLCAIPPGAEHLDFRGIQAFDANTAIVMSSGKGDLSRLYKTTDGCRNWRALKPSTSEAPDTDKNWNALSRPTSSAATVASPASAKKPSSSTTAISPLRERSRHSGQSPESPYWSFDRHTTGCPSFAKLR